MSSLRVRNARERRTRHALARAARRRWRREVKDAPIVDLLAIADHRAPKPSPGWMEKVIATINDQRTL
jgi:hypothetical protein